MEIYTTIVWVLLSIKANWLNGWRDVIYLCTRYLCVGDFHVFVESQNMRNEHVGHKLCVLCVIVNTYLISNVLILIIVTWQRHSKHSNVHVMCRVCYINYSSLVINIVMVSRVKLSRSRINVSHSGEGDTSYLLLD